VTGFAYCGVAPVPGALRWNLDPVLLSLLLILAGAKLAFAHSHRLASRDLAARAYGWLQDQQLGGQVTRVPAGLLPTAYSTFAFGAALGLDAPVGSRAEERAA